VKPSPDGGIHFDAGRSFRIPELPGTPLPRRAFVSTYFDTSDHRLARSEVTVRRLSERRTHHWEIELARGRARFELSGRGPSATPLATLGNLLTVYTRGAGLVPIATVATRRTGLVVKDPTEPVAEIVLDGISVLEDRRVVRRFRHVELRPVTGDEDAIGRIGTLLENAGAKRIEGPSPLFQALGIEVAPPLEPAGGSAPAAEQIQAMLRTQFESMRAHDPGTRLGADPEELHQMRTAVRRLRAILRAARPILDGWTEELRAELDWVGTALGVVRDLDVLRESLLGEIALFEASERPAGQRLLRRLDAERTREREALLALLGDPRYFALVDRLTERIESPFPPAPAEASLADLAAAEFKKLRKSVEKLRDEPSDDDLHAVRIKLKRARYTAELAQASVGRPARRFIDTSRKVQDILGEHQDAVVAEERLRVLLEGAPGRGAAFAAGRLVERQRSRQLDARRDFVKRWPKLERRGRKAWGQG
jgi:CHAD domain-containing protein